MSLQEHNCNEPTFPTKQAPLSLPEEDRLEELAQTFKIFGDPTRIKILSVLAMGEHSVNDISQIIGASQSSVSHQLRLLRAYRLVRARREGKAAYYSLDDVHVLSIISAGLEHIQEEDSDHE